MAFGPNPPPIQVHLCVKGGDAAIAFYEQAFGASCTFKKMAEDGKRVLHANIAMFGGEVMLHDEFPEYHGNVLSPISRGGASIVTHINLSEPSGVDNAVSRAEAAGRGGDLETRRHVLGCTLWPGARPVRACVGL